MGTFFIYILKVAFCQALFWLMYRLLMSRDTYHAFNRLMLWVLQALAFGLPLWSTTTDAPSPVQQGIVAAASVLTQEAEAASEGIKALTTVQILTLIYFIGVLLLTAISLLSIFRILVLTRSGRRMKDNHGANVTLLSQKIAPFSWFSHIVISQTENDDDQRAILLHEAAHVRLRHSWDTVANDLLTLLTWFNPFAWLLRRELSEVHEYEADADVLSHGVNPTNYQMLLIRKAAGERLFAIANNFHNNSLKKRITMMKSEKTRPWLRAKAALALPLALAIVAAFANPNVSAASEKAVAESNQTVDTLRLLAMKADVPPTYVTGETGLMKDLAKALVYPETVKTSGIVIAEFEVLADGSIGRVEIKKSLNAECDKAVVAAIKKLKKFNPAMQGGKAVTTWFSLPVSFRAK